MMLHRLVRSMVALSITVLIGMSLPRAIAASDTAERGGGYYGMRFERTPTAMAMTALGRKAFSDRSLSASGRQSCASCHDPARGFGPPDRRSVQLGGRALDRPGVRAVPSLRYLQNVPSFTQHYFETEGDDSADQGPAGGNNWDGRAPTKHDQARIPLLSPFEMANRDQADVVARLRRSVYAADIRAAFGAHVLDDDALAFQALVLALEVFQQSPSDFYPYSSRYDAYLRRTGTLTEAERRGLALFDDAAKGNCASCHPSAIRDGAMPSFTDFGFNALGVPRNPSIPANRDGRYFDLGLCGPLRTDLADHPEYCGLFRAPSLRNVAMRRTFFHNGAIHTLENAVRFYAERDVRPERWYPRRATVVDRFDDLPPRYRANVNREAPFGGRAGDRPLLTEPEVADIVAFLKTLTDRDLETPSRKP